MLKITFEHTAKQNDWFSIDYKAWVRIYAPLGSWFVDKINISSEPEYFKEFNKAGIGFWIEVPTTQKKIIELTYDLPESVINKDFYKILVQKQPGIESFNFKIQVKTKTDSYSKEKLIVCVSKWPYYVSLF